MLSGSQVLQLTDHIGHELSDKFNVLDNQTGVPVCGATPHSGRRSDVPGMM